MAYATTPYIYVSAGGDDGAAIQALIEAGERWIQSMSVTLNFDTVVDLREAGVPASGFRFEPGVGLKEVVIDVSGIGRDPVDTTNPSFAGFEYDGNFTGASYLAAASSAGDITVAVNSGAAYDVGQWVIFSDASTNPGVDLLPVDGTTETRKVIAIAGNVLTLNEALDRDHAINVIVAGCEPITELFFRDIRFTGNAASGIHLHCAHDGYFARITTDAAWRGRTMLLIDHGGIGNMVTDCYCTGHQAGDGPALQAWGVAIEGNKRTRALKSGGEHCGNGLILNFCIDCLAVEARAQRCSVNVGIYGGSIRSTILRPFIGNPGSLGTYISPDSVDCAIIDPQVFVETPLDPQLAKWRDYPLATSVGTTDSFLVVDVNGAARQVGPAVVVTRNAEGHIAGTTLSVKTVDNFGGDFRAANSGGSWLFGMLGAPGSKNFVLYDLKNGRLAMTVLEDGTSIQFAYRLLPSTGGALDVGASSVPFRNAYLSGTMSIGSNPVIGTRKTGWAPDTGTARRATNVTYTAGAALSFGASYAQAELAALAARLSAIETALQNFTQAQKAIKDDLISHGLIGV